MLEKDSWGLQARQKQCWKNDKWGILHLLVIEGEQIKWFGHHLRMKVEQLSVRAYIQTKKRSGYSTIEWLSKKTIDNDKAIWYTNNEYNTTKATHMGIDCKLILSSPPPHHLLGVCICLCTLAQEWIWKRYLIQS